MTKPRYDTKENETIPTNVVGAVYLFVKKFGPWSLMAVFLPALWWNGEKKSERWEALVDSGTKANLSLALAMQELTNEIKADHDATDALGLEVDRIQTTLTEVKTLISNK